MSSDVVSKRTPAGHDGRRDGPHEPGANPAEQDKEEQRERYRELLEELRVILPGVQVLFAFLLTVPFSSRFTDLDTTGRNIFAGSLLGVALTTAFLVAPTAIHRIAPDVDRAKRLGTATKLVVIGIVLLAISISIAVFVVTRFLFESTTLGVVFGAVTAVTFAALWFALPRAHLHDDD
jgi:uncharacterized BrkB/YihY/UPF0761 family membrane protein